MPASDKNKELLELEEISNEKKHWVRLTRVCNNSCMFCLDAEAMNSSTLEMDDIKKELERGLAKGAVRAILSGGEPTIHPDYLGIIALAKELGYEKVQTITNGRMFFYPKFLRDAVAAGLSEVTFSVHGHKPELHDRLTGIPGSFDQVMVALDNAKGIEGLIYNIDICVNRLNLPHLGEMLDFFIDLGVAEFDMLSVIPFGRAWENREELFFDLADSWQKIKEVLKRNEYDNIHIWLNRFSPEYLEGYEHMIQAPAKLHSDMEGMKVSYTEYLNGGQMPCAGERCRYCFMNKLCSYLFICRHLPQTGAVAKPDMQLNQETATGILENIKNGKLDLEQTVFGVSNDLQLEDGAVNAIDLKDFFCKLNGISEIPMRVYNVPYCLYPEGVHIDAFSYELVDLDEYGMDNIHDLVDDFIIKGYYVKSPRCKDCARDSECRGAHINYIRQFGFESLEPIK